MRDNPQREDVAAAMRLVNDAWLSGGLEPLATAVHSDMVMVLPGFAGRVQGREALVAGFRDFCDNARVHEFREEDTQIDVMGHTAVVTFRYAMLYERAGERYRATGRDLWVFEKHSQCWMAVWRTMLDIQETAA
ncbi:MAG TPA: nuclear transport factor 2 family protein [Vicinamibacterales bacterium]|nr:nuclear transport factor 2 family protein [Vicinamibacterales bacterium]